jgi:hypothetical protein
VDSYHRSGETAVLPAEQTILRRLETSNDEKIALWSDEILLIGEWMTKCIKRRYGSAKALTGAEIPTYRRIARAYELLCAQEACDAESRPMDKEFQRDLRLVQRCQEDGPICRLRKEMGKGTDRRIHPGEQIERRGFPVGWRNSRTSRARLCCSVGSLRTVKVMPSLTAEGASYNLRVSMTGPRFNAVVPANYPNR